MRSFSSAGMTLGMLRFGAAQVHNTLQEEGASHHDQRFHHFTQPWEVVLTYSRQPGKALTEDVCLERKQACESPWPKPR